VEVREVQLVGPQVLERAEPGEHALALAHREPGEIVRGLLGDEAPGHVGAGAQQLRRHRALEELRELARRRAAQVIEGGHHDAGGRLRGADRRACDALRANARVLGCRAQQQHVRRVFHRGVGEVAVCRPHRAGIEVRERLAACFHVGETAQPDEAVGTVDVAELPDHAHAVALLGLDELALEEIDQRVALPGFSVYWRSSTTREEGCVSTRLMSITQFVSHVLSPSVENACSSARWSG
jgi:hypothetical protein